MENPSKTALLVMDMQVPFLAGLPDAAPLVGNVSRAIDAARKKGIPVIFVVVGFRPGIPEVSANNKGFSAAKQRFAGMDMADFSTLHPDLTRRDDELLVVKRRVSAFTGSDLAVVLSAFGVNHIVLTGIATSGVVLSTLREAADKDFKITVLADGCADMDEEVHHVLTTKVFPRQADVVTVNEWV